MSGSWLRSLALGAGLVTVLGGCPDRGGNTTPTRKVRVHVRSFTEPAPVRMVTSAQPYAFTVSTQGLDRWDLRTGKGLHLSADHGLPGDRVAALVHDEQRGAVWIATDGGVTRYDIESGTFSALPKAPSVIGREDMARASLAPAGDGGLWIGHPKGLFYTNPAGAWSPTPVNAPVTALHRDDKGRLWIGTERGLMVRELSGETFELGPGEGCDLASVRFIAEAPDDSPLVVGKTAAGKQRIALIRGEACAAFRSSPDVTWRSAVRRGSETIILTPRRLFSMHDWTRRGRRLTRDGMRLSPVKVGDGSHRIDSPFDLSPIDARIPSGATALGAVGDEILIGTRDLGTARIHRKRRGTRWLRKSELVDGADTLSVACRTAKDCYLATGAPTAWRFDGTTFSSFGDGESKVLAFARGGDGTVWGLREGEDLDRILVSPIKDGIWVRVNEVAVETPGGRPAISFARFSPSGVLWIGLRYTDADGELRPYGVALVDTALGAVVYHHASRDEKERAQGVLPIPINVADACFHADDETWLATSEGAARVRGQKVDLYNETHGMLSELLRGVACSAGGMVWVASGRGIGGFDGEGWRHPKALRFEVNDLEMGPDSRLWMATDRGLGVYDGARVRRLDVRRGLLQNKVDDVAVDHLGRVWVRGAEGITVVTP